MRYKGELKEIERCIKKLNTAVEKLKAVFEYVDRGEADPFIDITYEDVKALREELELRLQKYQYFMNEFESNNIFIYGDNEPFLWSPTNINRGRYAPAYKADLDENKMYQMWKDGTSLKEISRQFLCSPDTVKRRILKLQLRDECGRKE